MEWIVPEEGGMSWIWNTAIIANRPPESQRLAEAFVNTTLDAELQLKFARLTDSPPTNVDAIKNLPDDLAHLRYSDEEATRLGEVQRQFDYLTMFMLRDQHIERWNKEVLAGL